MTRPTTTGKAQDLITFTRSTTGTYLGSDGLLKSAAINEARIEYDASGNCLGLLVEEARTNAKQYSEVFTTEWSRGATTVTSNSTDTTAPDSTNNATKIQVSGAAETRLRYTASFVQNVDYAFSVFAKAGTSSWLRLRNIGVGDGSSPTDAAWFNLSTGSLGTVASNLTPKIESVGNGWYRCSISGTVINPALALIDVSVVSGNGFINNNTVGDNIYIYGAQLETGSFPTSYIPTNGSTVTRSADVASLAVSEFGYNQDQGSVVLEAVMPPSVISEQFWILGSNTNSARWAFSNSTSPNVNAYDGASIFTVSSLQPSATQKMAIGTDQSTAIMCLDGVSGNQANTNGNISSLTTVFYFGGNNGGAPFLNGHIKSVQYYPLRLSNAQLQALTV